ncbi:hypothetical protein VNI00_017428 [Paramarasmius palmivorus]|uniref:Uncharacterized protein n=1 Tax=Paramarasmius palmivorus TaxID=297713 RepID=A0AAW0B632_9AGAR
MLTVQSLRRSTGRSKATKNKGANDVEKDVMVPDVVETMSPPYTQRKVVEVSSESDEDVVVVSSREKGVTEREKYTRSRGSVVFQSEDSDSGESAVSVNRSIAPAVEPGLTVGRFGSVDVDRDVVVAVKDRKGGINKGKGRASQIVPVPSREPSPVNAWDEMDATLSDKGEAGAKERSVAVKRRIADGESASPSKVRVKDLTVSPRKSAIKENENVRVDNVTNVKRSSGRVKKPTYRMTEPEKPKTLLAKLDAAMAGEVGEDRASVSDRHSDTSYEPNASRMRVKSPRKSSRIAATASKAAESVSATNGHLTDTDDDLPSPLTAMSRSSDEQAEQSGVESRAGKGVPDDTERKSALDNEARGEDDIDHARSPSAVESVTPTRRIVAASVRETEALSAGRVVRGQVIDKQGSKIESEMVRLESAQKSASDSASGNGPSVFSGSVSMLDDSGDDDESSAGDNIAHIPTSAGSLLDADRVHPELVTLYNSMPLKRAKFIGYPNNESAFDGFTPVSYGYLLDVLIPRVRSKLVRSVLFEQYKDIKNISRVPLNNFARSWECVRVPYAEGNRPAAFLFTGVCSRSYVGQGREVGQSYVKQLHVRPIENDWEIMQGNIGTFFNDTLLHAPGRNGYIVFQTKRQGWTPRSSDRDYDRFASTPYSSPAKASSSRRVVQGEHDTVFSVFPSSPDIASVNILRGGAPPYRSFDDGMPLYDGRSVTGRKGFRFEANDWENYSSLPRYPFAEVSENTLVSVVFTLTGFRGNGATHHTVHFNGLFAIVLGSID